MEPLATEQHDAGVTVEVHYDQDSWDPRGWDNIGTMVCWHRHADLGDETINTGDYADAQDMLRQVTGDDDPIILPLWLYEHSGMTMRAGDANPFHDPWDSGQVGFIYCTRQDAKTEYGDTQDSAERAIAYMTAEVQAYDSWLRGDVYGWVAQGPDDTYESCWGYVGCYDECLTEGRDAAQAMVDDIASATAAAWLESHFTMFAAPL